MKKIALVCTLLAALCMVAFAGEVTDRAPAPDKNATIKAAIPMPVVPLKADGTPMNTEVIKHNGVAREVIANPAEDEASQLIKRRIEELEITANSLAAIGDEVSLATVKAELDALYATLNPVRDASTGALDAVGDDCTNPIIVTLPAQMPYGDVNTNCGRINDYANTCLGSYDGGEDIIYQIDVTAPVTINITLTSTTTYKGMAIDNVCPLDAGTADCIAKVSSSGSGPLSIPGLALAVGTYYLMIDTWPSPNCIPTFTLEFTDPNALGRCCYRPVGNYYFSCVDTMQAACATLGGMWNASATCATAPCDQPPANDFCASAAALTIPASIQINNALATNDTIISCGVGGTMGAQVWYTVIGDGSTYTATTCNAYTDYDTEVQVFCGSCTNLICVGGNDDAGSTICPISSVRSVFSWCTEAGRLYYIAAGSYSYASGRGNMQLDITSDGIPCSNAICCLAVDTTFTAPYSYAGTTCGKGNDCDLEISEDMMIKVQIPYAGLWTFDLCNSDYDTRLYIGTLCCSDDVGYNDDNADFCQNPNNDYVSAIPCLDLTAGYYYVEIEGWSGACGNFVLNVQPCTPPTGRCCYGTDPYNPLCADVTEAECLTLGGSWTYGLACATDACPALQLGDSCNNALVIPSLPYTDVNSTCGAVDDVNLTADYCISNYYDNGPDKFYRMEIFERTCITIDLTQVAYDYASVSLWSDCPMTNPTACIVGAYASTGPLHIACTELLPGIYWIMVDNWPAPPCTNYTLTITPCDCPSSCETWVNCGEPVETEPNDLCPTQVDPNVIGCGGMVFGKICPAADRDVYQIVVPPMTIMTLNIFDDADCMTDPPVCVRNNIMDANCAVLGSGNIYGWIMTNDAAVPWVLFLDVYALSGCQATYQIVTECCDIVDYCANPLLTHGVYTFTATMNTCCATNVIPMIGTSCAATYASGPDFIVAFTLDQDCVIDTIEVIGAGNADEQVWLGTNCADPLSCVASADNGGSDAVGELLTGLTLTAGTYYVAGSYYGATACGLITITIKSQCLLPVEFTGATAEPGDRSVTVKWTTASETDMSRFEIVRNGETVGSVNATNTAVRHDYSFTETGLENGVLYSYNLVGVDVGGVRQVLATVEASPSEIAANVTEYALHQNYPNPFNPTTAISFDLKEAGFVTLKVYNLMGQAVATILNSEMSGGRHNVTFDATSLSSGVYLYRIEVNGFAAEKKMLLMK